MLKWRAGVVVVAFPLSLILLVTTSRLPTRPRLLRAIREVAVRVAPHQRPRHLTLSPSPPGTSEWCHDDNHRRRWPVARPTPAADPILPCQGRHPPHALSTQPSSRSRPLPHLSPDFGISLKPRGTRPAAGELVRPGAHHRRGLTKLSTRSCRASVRVFAGSGPVVSARRRAPPGS
jgi:hypothetical protein